MPLHAFVNAVLMVVKRQIFHFLMTAPGHPCIRAKHWYSEADCTKDTASDMIFCFMSLSLFLFLHLVHLV